MFSTHSRTTATVSLLLAYVLFLSISTPFAVAHSYSPLRKRTRTAQEHPGSTAQTIEHPSVAFITIAHADVCKNKREIIGNALEHFSSGDYDQSLQAKSTLLKIAHQSNKCREVVIRTLMQRMDQPNLDFERQPANYYLWREGSQLLGE